MGEVWEAVHPPTAVATAVKFIASGHAWDNHYLRAFRQEARNLARLDHRAIVAVFDHGEVPAETEQASGGRLKAGQPYLVMELARGGSLSSWIGEPWSLPDLQFVLSRILEGLAHAHARGILHRDLKPGNVLLAHAGDLRPGIKLCDFGLSGIDHAFSRAGSPAYMAPEQIRGETDRHGPWTDLYALGCLAWEMTTGRPPFIGSTTREVLQGHLFATPIPPCTAAGAALGGWLMRLLAKECEERFSCAADAARALAALDLTEAPPPLAPDSGRTWTCGTAPSPSQVPPPDEAAARPSPPPPVPAPADWRGPADETLALSGVGLGLFGHRQAPLIGRTPERDLLWGALREVSATRASLGVLIRGEAGVGKTRLARWLAERAEELGVATACFVPHNPGPGGDAAGFLVRRLGVVGLSAEEAQERLDALLARQRHAEPGDAARLLHLIGLGGASASPLPPAERLWLLRRYLLPDRSDRPAVLVLDDVHWSQESLALAQSALSSSLPTLVVLTTSEDGPALDLALREIRLAPLEEEDYAELVDRLLSLEAKLAAEVRRHGGGNPMFAVQLIGDWVRQGVLVPGRRGFQQRPGARASLPDGLPGVWNDRLKRLFDSLEPHAREILRLGAALGLEVDRAEWERACALAGAAWEEQVVEACVSARVLEERRQGWAFVHALARAAVEQEARASARWPAINAACAQALAAGPGQAERTGRHLVLADQPLRALAHLLCGVDEAIQTGAYRQADALIQIHRATLAEAGIPIDDIRHGEVLLREAQLHLNRGEFGEAQRVAASLAEAADRHDWPALLTSACRYLGMVASKRGDYVHAVALLRQAREDAKSTGQSIEWARATMYLGVVWRQRGNAERATALLREARAAFVERGDTLGVADCDMELASVALVLQSDAITGEAVLRRALEGYSAVGNRAGVGNCRNTLGDLLRRVGDLRGAEVEYRDAHRILDSLGAHTRVFPHLNLGLILLHPGRDADPRSMEEVQTIAEAALRTERKNVRAYSHALLLTPSARMKAWRAHDENLASLQALLSEIGLVDPDLAWLLRRGGDEAAAHNEPSRAGAAWRLAAAQYRALGNSAESDALKAAADQARSG